MKFIVKFNQNFLFLAGLLALNVISFFLSLIALVAMSIYAISFYDNCSGESLLVKAQYCLLPTSRSKSLYWTMMSFGIISTLLSGVFILVFANVVNKVYANTKKPFNLNFLNK